MKNKTMGNIKKRCGVFETNSSSSHSITISDENSVELMDIIYPNSVNEDIIILHGGEFGWEWEKYNDALTKANYCAQAEIDQPMLMDVIREQTGYSIAILLNDGYIDHNSSHVATEAFKSPETLRQFIFNKKSILYLGNDNGVTPHGFYDPIGTVYTYLLKLHFQDEVYTWKCKDDIFEDGNLIDAITSCFEANLPDRWGMDANLLKYYEFKSYLPMQEIALKSGCVILHQVDLLDIARKECPTGLNEADAWKWVVQKTYQLQEDSKYQLKVQVELIEI